MLSDGAGSRRGLQARPLIRAAGPAGRALREAAHGSSARRGERPGRRTGGEREPMTQIPPPARRPAARRAPAPPARGSAATAAAPGPPPAPGRRSGLGDPRLRRGVTEILAMIADRLQDGASQDEALPLIGDAVRAWAERQVRAGAPVLAPADREALAQAVYDQRYGLGPLAGYLRDPQVENVDVNGCDEVWVTYATGERVIGPPVAASDDELIAMIRNWAARGGQTARDFSAASPLVSVALAGGARMTATMSVTPRPCVSLRRHGQLDVTLGRLIQLGTIDPTLAGFLAAAVQEPLQHHRHRRRERGQDHAAAGAGRGDPAGRAGRHPGIGVRAVPARDPAAPGRDRVRGAGGRTPRARAASRCTT